MNARNISGRNVIVLQDIRCEKLNCKHGDYYIKIISLWFCGQFTCPD